MTLGEITPLHLNREWNRLLKSGGHHRRTKAPRALSARTVRNIAGLVSSPFSRAIKWGLVTTNPVTNSEPPRVKSTSRSRSRQPNRRCCWSRLRGPGYGPTSK
jgi:hypothetical protein